MRSRTFVTLSLVSLLGACTTPAIAVRVVRPGPVNLAQYGLVAVDRFGGPGCDEFAEELIAALHNTKNPLNGKEQFDVVCRRDVDKAMDSLRGRAGKTDDETGAIVERWRSARLMIKGEVREYGVTEQVRVEQIVDPQKVSHQVRIRQAQARVVVSIEVCDAQGDVVFDKVECRETVTASTKGVDCQPAPIDPAPLLASARCRVVEQYMRRVMPHEDWVKVRLYSDSKIPELRVGNSFAASGDWESALASYRDGLGRATGELQELRYMALFNLGVAQEYTNRFAEARQSLKEAYTLQQDEQIVAELANLAQRERDYQKLLEQTATPAK
jgi:hypothetical protein